MYIDVGIEATACALSADTMRYDIQATLPGKLWNYRCHRKYENV